MSRTDRVEKPQRGDVGLNEQYGQTTLTHLGEMRLTTDLIPQIRSGKRSHRLPTDVLTALNQQVSRFQYGEGLRGMTEDEWDDREENYKLQIERDKASEAKK